VILGGVSMIAELFVVITSGTSAVGVVVEVVVKMRCQSHLRTSYPVVTQPGAVFSV